MTGFQYHYWNGLLIPYLRIKRDETLWFTPFFGYRHFLFSEQRYCTTCLTPSEETNWTGWCTSCQGEPFNLQLSCLFTQAGHPFGTPCDPHDHPQCGDESFCQRYCQAEYVIYWGRLGIYSKVGITRRYLGDAPQGYLSRIMDQGFDEVLVFEGLTPLSLAWAQQLEQELARHFKVSTIMGFEDKLQALIHAPHSAPSVFNFQDIGLHIHKVFPELVLLDHVILTQDYWDILAPQFSEKIPLMNCPITRYPMVVAGEVMLARGELVLLKSSSQTFWINLRDLQGRVYYQGEE
ncbi:MAG: hypothetical protein ACFFFG_18175 [Candidatus Thorarchaeota archaeon]